MNTFIKTIFIVLIAGAGFMQAHLKSNPQIFIIAFGVITLIAFLIRKEDISTFFFYILLSYMLFVSYFFIIDSFTSLVNPNRGLINIDGQQHEVMDFSWLWGAFLGGILSLLTVYLYNKSKRRDRSTELIVTIIFIIVLSIVYIAEEVL